MLEECQSYCWPGNLRELENFVKKYLVMGDEELAIAELHDGNGGAGTTIVPGMVGLPGTSLKSLLQDVKGQTERTLISEALEKTHWNRKAAARLLRVSYRTLLYKIEQYQMRAPEHDFIFFSNHSKTNAQRG